MKQHKLGGARRLTASLVVGCSLSGCAHEPRVLLPVSPDHHRVFGQAIDDNTIDFTAEVEFLRFIVSHDDDRETDKVGAELELCKDFVISDETDCVTIRYFFPELTYDPQTRDVKWGDEVLEHRGTWAWTYWKSSRYRLGLSKTEVKRGDGFDSHSVHAYSVYLEPLAERATAQR